MRALIIDHAAKAKVAKVRDHAERHHYTPGPGVSLPGDDPRFVAQLGNYRAVFSFTHHDGKIWRHLTVSVPSHLYPHPAAAFVIADLFGFTGWDGRTIDQIPPGWIGDINKQEHCVTLVQALSPIGIRGDN